MLTRLADIRTAIPIHSKQSGRPFTPVAGLKQNLIGLRQHMANFAKHLFAMAIEVTEADRKLLKELRDDTAALLVMLDERLMQFSFSPGKTKMEADSNGN
jgi:hypothetical protein